MIACSRKDQCPALVLWRARSTAEGCRMLRVPRVASGKRAWREDYRGETNVTSKVANFRVREAHGICVWACRLPRRLVVRFSRELLSAFASQPGHFVKSCRRLALYRNFTSWYLYVLCLSPAFCEVVRSPADEHEITSCSRRDHLIFRLA